MPEMTLIRTNGWIFRYWADVDTSSLPLHHSRYLDTSQRIGICLMLFWWSRLSFTCVVFWWFPFWCLLFWFRNDFIFPCRDIYRMLTSGCWCHLRPLFPLYKSEFSLFFLFNFDLIHILKNLLVFYTVVRFSQFKMFRWHNISVSPSLQRQDWRFHIKHKNPDTNSQCLKKYPKHT